MPYYFMVVMAFSGGSLLVFGANLIFSEVASSNRKQVRERIEEELRLRRRARAQESVLNQDLYQKAASAAAAPAQVRLTLREKFATLLDESGLALQSRQLVGLCGLLAAMVAAPVGLIGGHWVLAALVAPVAASLPLLYVCVKRSRRMEKLRSQLPDAFDMMTRTLRAGETLTRSFQAVAEEFAPPVSTEFGYCLDQQNLGLSPEAALRDLARRTGLLELRIFVLAVMIHRQTGGNFAELLHRLSVVIRERYRIRGAIKSLTAEGRLQAIVLLALPPVMLGMLLVINRPYVMTLFRYPWVLTGTGIAMALGGVWIHKIIRFDF
ncbi:MAG: type II secretion system F family protein [Thermoguttaceae bacterium]|jgi:tight adherence protein B